MVATENQASDLSAANCNKYRHQISARKVWFYETISSIGMVLKGHQNKKPLFCCCWK